MESLQQSASRALADVLRDQPVTPGKIALAWQVAAGPALGRAGRPAWTGDGVLYIHPRDAAWGREILRARPVIVERLGQMLGQGVVRTLIVDE